METRLKELEDKMREFEKGLEGSKSKLRTEVEESSMFSNTSLTKPYLRDVPIVLISAWQPNALKSPQIVTFESFLANYNNGGGDGVLDLDSGVFTCITPGYYTVSFSVVGLTGPDYGTQRLFLYKNGDFLPESLWFCDSVDANSDLIVTGSRIMVRS